MNGVIVGPWLWWAFCSGFVRCVNEGMKLIGGDLMSKGKIIQTAILSLVCGFFLNSAVLPLFGLDPTLEIWVGIIGTGVLVAIILFLGKS